MRPLSELPLFGSPPAPQTLSLGRTEPADGAHGAVEGCLLHPVPERPAANYSRLSCLDDMGAAA